MTQNKSSEKVSKIFFGESLGSSKIIACSLEEILILEEYSPTIMNELIGKKGIITTKGGYMSHIAIFSRELGIPCIKVDEKNLEEIKKSKMVVLNGKQGIVIAIQ